MQYLLDPCLLIGEPGYYLTTLASSVILLKSLEFEQGGSVQITPTLGHLQSMLQIFFTDPDMQVGWKLSCLPFSHHRYYLLLGSNPNYPINLIINWWVLTQIVAYFPKKPITLGIRHT